MTTASAPVHALTYTPAVFDHLEALRRSYEAQRDSAMHRLEECEADGDSDGVRIAQIDLTLATIGLAKVVKHLSRANAKMANLKEASHAE